MPAVQCLGLMGGHRMSVFFLLSNYGWPERHFGWLLAKHGNLSVFFFCFCFFSSAEFSLSDSAHVNGRKDEWRRVALGCGTWEGPPAKLKMRAEVGVVAVGGGGLRQILWHIIILEEDWLEVNKTHLSVGTEFHSQVGYWADIGYQAGNISELFSALLKLFLIAFN